jgi:hypothetical protein
MSERQWTPAELALPDYVRARILQLLTPGLGDRLAAVATPIARALGFPCIDKETGQLKPTSNCAKRRAALNKIGSK